MGFYFNNSLIGGDTVNRKKEKKNNKNNKQNKNLLRVCYILCTIAILVFIAFGIYSNTKPVEYDISYLEFQQMLKDGDIERVEYNKNSETITIFENNSDKGLTVLNPGYDDFRKDLLESGVKLDIKKSTFTNILINILINVPSLILVGILIYFLSKSLNIGGSSNFKIFDGDEAVTFKDVAGMDDIKSEVQFAVDALKNHTKLASAGARPTRGIILEGPPGTGKTLLARAIAGEAKVPLISTSGSDFVEMFVGLGAARVRQLYKLARSQAPCVIFIDEIDAVGRKRRSGNSADTEGSQTLNALLQKMDGIGSGDGILVIAATNFIEDLDPALLRPGRFDRRIAITAPNDKQSRDEIIKVHLKNKTLESGCDFEKISKLMFGLTGAEIASVLNEAVILSIRDSRDGIISIRDIDEATMKLRTSGVVIHSCTDNDKKIAAIHEAGHAIMNCLNGRAVSKVSITAYNSGVGGITITDVDCYKDKFRTKSQFIGDIEILLAGMVAERIVFGEHTFGCSNDLERATAICKQIIFSYGMLEDNVVNLKGLNSGEYFLDDSKIIMDKVNKMLIECKSNTYNKLLEYKDELLRLAERLQEEETVLDYTLVV